MLHIILVAQFIIKRMAPVHRALHILKEGRQQVS